MKGAWPASIGIWFGPDACGLRHVHLDKFVDPFAKYHRRKLQQPICADVLRSIKEQTSLNGEVCTNTTS